jgi:hypothetical protein
MDDREISPDDIYKVLSTKDRDTYDEAVTSLRKTDILKEIRSNSAAQQMAKQKNTPKAKISRFKVKVP